MWSSQSASSLVLAPSPPHPNQRTPLELFIERDFFKIKGFWMSSRFNAHNSDTLLVPSPPGATSEKSAVSSQCHLTV